MLFSFLFSMSYFKITMVSFIKVECLQTKFMFCHAIKPNSAKNQLAFAVKAMHVHFTTTRKIVEDHQLCISIGEILHILRQEKIAGLLFYFYFISNSVKINSMSDSEVSR